MSGCLPPCNATVAFCSALSLLTYCTSMWTFGYAASNRCTMSWIERYSCDSATGGGGVYPIHIVRLMSVPLGMPVAPPLLELLELLLHAAATIAIAIGTTSQSLCRCLFIGNLPSGRRRAPR